MQNAAGGPWTSGDVDDPKRVCCILLTAYSGADRIRAEPFEQVELDLPLLWDEPANARR